MGMGCGGRDRGRALERIQAYPISNGGNNCPLGQCASPSQSPCRQCRLGTRRIVLDAVNGLAAQSRFLGNLSGADSVLTEHVADGIKLSSGIARRLDADAARNRQQQANIRATTSPAEPALIPQPKYSLLPQIGAAWTKDQIRQGVASNVGRLCLLYYVSKHFTEA